MVFYYFYPRIAKIVLEFIYIFYVNTIFFNPEKDSLDTNAFLCNKVFMRFYSL